MKSKLFFNATIVMSPATLGGETKNQDRAEFFSPVMVACVCDGVSTSPHSARAAELGTAFSSTLFNGDVNKQLETLSNILIEQRFSACDKGVTIENQPESMKMILQEAAKEKLKYSFQTTLVAAKFSPQDKYVDVKLAWCGDSGFFAFSKSGELLFTNLSIEEASEDIATDASEKIPFGPDDAIFVKVLGKLSDYPDFSKRSSIKIGQLCKVLSSASDNTISTGEHPPVLWLKRDETLFVPAYLASTPKDPQYNALSRVIYSRFIQRASSPVANKININLNDPNNTTEVLPDHFFTGDWNFMQDEFPKEAEFLFCSDGFYRSFDNPTAMLTFLKRYKASSNKEQFMDYLHQKLNNTFGDDDISFVWISPNEVEEQNYAK